jgi:hypothetical protein
VAAFALAFFLRMSAAYGPLNLSLHPSDWAVLWELWRHGQIATRVVAQGVLLGAVAAAVLWVLLGRSRRQRGR